jgi:hypothetical protein
VSGIAPGERRKGGIAVRKIAERNGFAWSRGTGGRRGGGREEKKGEEGERGDKRIGTMRKWTFAGEITQYPIDRNKND